MIEKYCHSWPPSPTRVLVSLERVARGRRCTSCLHTIIKDERYMHIQISRTVYSNICMVCAKRMMGGFRFFESEQEEIKSRHVSEDIAQEL